MKPNTARIKALLNAMLKSKGGNNFLIENFYNEVLKEFNSIEFVAPDNLLNYDKVYKDFIKAVMKNYLYEKSEDNKNSVLDVISFLQSLKVLGE